MLIIQEKDFIIKQVHSDYILIIKSKSGKPQIYGYFTNSLNALKKVYSWRKSKKYPHKEDAKEILSYIKIEKECNLIYKKIKDISNKPYKDMRENIFGIQKIPVKKKPKC